MKLNEVANLNPFHSDTTEMPFYDDLLKADDDMKAYFKREKGLVWELKNMSPDEYIDAVVKGFSSTKERLMSGRDTDKIKDFAEQMKSGKKFPILTLDYSKGKRVSQEGVHRALAAKEANVSTVPVLIIKGK